MNHGDDVVFALLGVLWFYFISVQLSVLKHDFNFVLLLLPYL